MFERFTDRARTVVVMAQEEARGLGHHYIGTEHLLLGLLAEGNGVAARVLNDAAITLEMVRGDVVRITGEVKATPGGSIPFTPRAKTVLECSLRESLRLSHNYIDTEHILLGIVDEGQGTPGVAAQILASHGFSLDDVRSAVLDRLGHPAGSLAVGSWRGGTRVRQGAASRMNTTPAVADLYVRARELAVDGPVSSAHMLRAFVATPDSQAARALASLGVDADDIERALAETPTAGTTDERPEETIARIASVRAEKDRIVVEIADADLARRLGAGTVELSSSLATFVDQLHTGLRRETRADEETEG